MKAPFFSEPYTYQQHRKSKHSFIQLAKNNLGKYSHFKVDNSHFNIDDSHFKVDYSYFKVDSSHFKVDISHFNVDYSQFKVEMIDTIA